MRLWSPSLSSSSPSVRFLASTRFDSASSMASRPHYRGGRYRGYCDRSALGEGENVAGDLQSHQGRGRGFNSGFRPVNGGEGYLDGRSYSYNNVSSSGQFGPRPPQFQQYRAPQFQQNRPPYVHQNHGFDGRPVYGNYNAPMNMNAPPGSVMGSSYGGHRQVDYVNQQRGQPNQFRPRNSKPLDFREWEYAKPEPPRHWERFTILTYNILADYLANEHWRKLYFHIPRHMLSWEWRKNNIFYELRLWSPDIMCFQEVDRFQDLAMEFNRQGYDGIYKMRTGNPIDGCSVFWRSSKFKLLHEESIEFNNLGFRDNVAQICVLESVQLSLMENPSASNTSSACPNRVVVCNIHVLYNPKRGDIKLGQVRVLLDKANAVSKAWNNAPLVVCGDFNCTPKSPLYNYISEQKLDLSGLGRDKVSGQASAEIQAPLFNRPNAGIQASMKSVPSTTYSRLNTQTEKTDSHSDSQNQIIASGTMDDLLSQPQHVHEDNKPNGTMESEGELSSVTSGTVVDLQCPPKNVHADEPNGTRASEGELSSVTSGTMVDVDLQGQPLHVNPEEPNGTGTLEGKVISGPSGDVEDVINSIKNSPPFSSGPNIISLKSRKIETDIPYGEIAPSEQSTDGTIKMDNNVPQNVTDFFPTSDASSCFENIFEEPANNLGENETVGEDGDRFLSELTGDSFNSHNNQLVSTDQVEREQNHDLSPDESEPISPERIGYSSSLWTRTEIETATGNGDCTSLEHPLQLTSTYTETEDLLGTRDGNGEPLITSYNRCFCGTVDYIWRSEGLRTVKVLSPMRKEAMQWTAGFPTKKWGSDHIALVSQLAFVHGSQENQRD